MNYLKPLLLVFALYSQELLAANFCINSLRNYYEQLRQNVPPKAEEPLSSAASTTPATSSRKEVAAAIESEKTATRRRSVVLLGDLSLQKEYFEEVDVFIKGKKAGKTFRLKKVEALVEDINDITTDLRKLLKQEDAEKVEMAPGYIALLKDFIEYYEDVNPSWIENKIKTHMGFIRPDTTLFDLIDMLVEQHGIERGILSTPALVEKRTLSSFFFKLFRVSPASLRYLKSETRKYYQKRAIALTTGLPATILYQAVPNIILLGIPVLFMYMYHQDNTVEVVKEQIAANENENKLAMTQAQKDELKRSLSLLDANNKNFRDLIQDTNKDPAESWKQVNDAYIDISKMLAKFSGTDRLSIDPTTRAVIDAFIKEVKSRAYTPTEIPSITSTSYFVGRKLAAQALITPLLNGSALSKDDVKKEMSTFDDIAMFNKGFYFEAIKIAGVLHEAVEAIPAESSPETSR